MTGIFISYRREDTGPYAGRLYDMLAAHFGRDRVFFDIDTIEPGEDFREVIERSWASCKVLLVVIGRQWATVCDKNGNLRLNKENDLVRIEIASALQKGLRVIPVLAGGADMPEEATLPPDLRALAYRHAWDISDKHFHQDVQILMEAIEKTVGGDAPPKTPSTTAQPKVPPAIAPPETSSLFPLYGITLGKSTRSDLA